MQACEKKGIFEEALILTTSHLLFLGTINIMLGSNDLITN